MKHLCIATGLLILSTGVYAKTIELKCPAEIKTTQTLQKTPDEFASQITPASHFWDKVTFYSGKPADNVSLAPDSSNKGKSVWNFSANDSIYYSCGYNQTSMELFKALPEKIKTCTVEYNQHMQPPQPEKILCE